MPNWCECELTITGPTEQLISFRDGIKMNTDGSYLQILVSYYPIPQALDGIKTGRRPLADGRTTDLWREGPRGADNMPQEIQEVSAVEQETLMRCYGATNWYDWCKTCWGSKWGDCHTVLCGDRAIDGHRDSLVYRFDAAWCCPCKGFEEVSRQFPLLNFSIDYREEMVGFAGSYVCRNGKGRDKQWKV